ncbi:hypothetical protein EVAR_11638_1 [Eumeta japonica]|uniref:ATP-dependent DNA helicase n=1 Tax=Eumeta variegata TaxID=151549 RepID=A0A4C1WXY3_EUMVA|nr:hypothetical protein EVAR_11638_1 [Eumeta japonica]
MSHKRAIEALDRSLQDIRGNRILMGGLVVLLAGDFRQMLPVIEVQLFNDQKSGLFAQTLLEVGEGRMPTDTNGQITFDGLFNNVVSSEDNLINEVFPSLQENLANEKLLCERTIMAPKNELVGKINQRILEQVLEILNFLNLSRVRFHKLELKVGVPVILMHNLDEPRLCNGTRLCITELRRHIVQATILLEGTKERRQLMNIVSLKKTILRLIVFARKAVDGSLVINKINDGGNTEHRKPRYPKRQRTMWLRPSSAFIQQRTSVKGPKSKHEHIHDPITGGQL